MTVFLLVILGLSVLLAIGTVFVVVVGKALEDKLAVLDRMRTQDVVRLHQQTMGSIGPRDHSFSAERSRTAVGPVPDECDEAAVRDGS